MSINKKPLLLALFLISLVFADGCECCYTKDLGGDGINNDTIPTIFIENRSVGWPRIKVPTAFKGPYIAANIAEINSINIQNNILLIGGLSSIFQVSDPYGSPAASSGRRTVEFGIVGSGHGTSVTNAGDLQTKVFSLSPEMNENASVVYNSRGFPESEFELQAPMITYGIAGGFFPDSAVPIPIINITTNYPKGEIPNYHYKINVQECYVGTKVVNPQTGQEECVYPDKPTGNIAYFGTLQITKEAVLQEFCYINVSFLALSKIINMSAFPDLLLDWNIQPFGISGSYFLFSPFNVFGQEHDGEVKIEDVATGLAYSYLASGGKAISKEELLAGIKNIVYHTVKIPVSDIGPNDAASTTAEAVNNALSQTLNLPGDNFAKAKTIAAAIAPNTKLPQKYLLDPFVFNGSEMLIASYYNASAKQHQLYELWYINTTTYYNPELYYRDSFQTNLAAVGGFGNKIYTVENETIGKWPFETVKVKYYLNTYEIIPVGYYRNLSLQPPSFVKHAIIDVANVASEGSTPSPPPGYPTPIPVVGPTSPPAPTSVGPTSPPSSQHCHTRGPKNPAIALNEAEEEKFFGLFHSQFEDAWIKFFGKTIYEETHDLYKVKSIPLDDCSKFVSFTVDKFTGIAYVLCKFEKPIPEKSRGIHSSGWIYRVYDSNGKERILETTEDLSTAQIASFGGILLIGSHGTIKGYQISQSSQYLTEIGSPMEIVYNDLNISAYAKYAYNTKCVVHGGDFKVEEKVNDKADYHNILAMGVYNGFIYLVDQWKPGCGINEVRLRILGIKGDEVIVNPFDKNDRVDCYKQQSCGVQAIAPPYGWTLASSRKDSSAYTFYPSGNKKFGFPEIGAPISDTYSANMSIDDFGKIYLITSGNGKGLAIIDFQPFNYTLSSFGAGSLYACISTSAGGSKVIIEKRGVGTKMITQNTKCLSGSVDDINYLYGSPNILNYLNQIRSFPTGVMFSGIGIAANIATIEEGIEKFNPQDFFSQGQKLSTFTFSPSQTTLVSAISGEVVLPFYSLYLFNQTANITYNGAKIVSGSCCCPKPPPSQQIIPYPEKGKVNATFTFSTTSVGARTNTLQTKFESSNMVFVVYTILNGTILPAFLYHKSLPQQTVSLSLFKIVGLGSKGFGEAYLNVTPISAYGAPVDTRSSPISKIRIFDYYTKIWGYGNTVLNATGVTQQTEDTDLQNDYYINVEKVIQSAVEALATKLKLDSVSKVDLSSRYFASQLPIINKKVPLLVFVINNLSVLSNDNLLGRRIVNVTFVDLFNTTFNLPMKLDFAYSTKINATLNISIDKKDKNLTHVTVSGNLSKVVFDATTNSFKYTPLPGRIYLYVDRNINYCNNKEYCSKSLAEENPTQAILCSIENCPFILANPLNFSEEGNSMEPAANTINYKTLDPKEKKNIRCDIYGNGGLPNSCSKGYYCLPVYPNGTGYCTSQVGLVNFNDSKDGNFKFNFDIYGLGIEEQVILKYYGYPSFQKTESGYVENYAYLPSKTILSLNGVLPLKLGSFSSVFVIFIICFLAALIFIFRRKLKHHRKIFI